MMRALARRRRTVRCYVYAVAALAGVAAAGLLARHPMHLTPALFLFAIPAVLSGPRAIRLGGRVEMLAAQPFLFGALLAAGVAESLLAAGLCALAFGLARRRPLPPDRVIFNVASLSLTQAAAAWAYLAAGGRLAPGLDLANDVPALMLAALVFFVVNSSTVSAAVALSEGAGPVAVWREKFLWSFPSPFAGASLAFGMAAALDRFGPYALLLAAPPSVLIYYSYRLYRERREEHLEHVAEVERMNAELEAKVRERTAELSRVNGELADSNRRLADASRMKSEFLATMSHELRTPLNAIIGFSELLLDARICRIDDEPKEYARDILASGRHLLDMINDILDLSKVEAGKMDLNLESAELGLVIHEAISMVVPLAERKRLTLQRPEADEEVMVRVDPVKVRQILYNLLSNAAKFTPEGGRIAVSWRVTGADLQLAVSDTGIGIAPEDQERIFQEFMQVDSSLGRRYAGTGLGLSLVRKFAAMHGGSVRVESEPGKGATFLVDLPRCRVSAAAPEAATTEAAGPAAVPDRRGETILLVEDNEVNRKLARRLLAAGGYDVREAACAQEGIEAARAERPALILMDLQLPDMDGLQAARILSLDPRTRDIPVVALTAHASDGDEDRAREAGCVGFLRKPIEAAQFARRVREHIGSEPLAVTAGGR